MQAEPETPLSDIMDRDPVRVMPDADVVDVTLLMADYNLMTVPVVDAEDQLLGVITVDDVLEATIPDDWRRREPPPHPEPLHPPADQEFAHAAHSADSRPAQPSRPEPKG